MNNSDLLHLIQRATFGISTQEYMRFAPKNAEDIVKILFDESKIFTLFVEKDVAEDEDIRDRTEAINKENRREIRKENRQAIRQLNTHWLTQMMTSTAQIREKVAFFWHGHLACQPKMLSHALHYTNLLREKGLGKFGDLLLSVSKSPAMIGYLNNQQNRKNKPNENFAREILELFTLGRGNYTEKDIKESARAFTGWAFFMGDFIFKEKQHDQGEKIFFGKKGNWKGEDIIRMILEKKETADFLVKKIYKFFVNENTPIPNEVLADLSKRYFESEYDTGKLLAYIFTQKWFYEQKNKAQKIKSPIEFLTNLQRLFGIQFENPESLLIVQKILGQILLYPPNVAGWAGGKTWIDSSTLLFRLRLGNILYRVSDIEVQVKEEFDVQNKGLVAGNLKKLKASFDWNNLEKFLTDQNINLKNSQEITQKLVSILLPYSPKNVFQYVETQLKSFPTENPTRVIALALVSLPEYQIG